MNVALILLGGEGKRMGLNVPKQFLLHNNRPIFLYTLDTFESCQKIDKIILVCHKDFLLNVKKIIKENDYSKVTDIISGGNTRGDSVKNGLKLIQDEDIVLIHDGVRIFVTEDIILRNIEKCQKNGNAITAVKETNSLSIVKNNEVVECLDRNYIYIHQTPQTFLGKLIKDLYINGNPYTDEANLLIKNKIKTFIVEGSYSNIKITTKDDLIKLRDLQ